MEKYRRGIIAVIINEQGDILLGERSDATDVWQFPQGGIEIGESPTEAFFREVAEELGNSNCEVLKISSINTFYRWPQAGKDFVGQEQTWFLAVYKRNQFPDLSKSDGCFKNWQWKKPTVALNLIIEWKRKAFAEGLEHLGILTSK